MLNGPRERSPNGVTPAGERARASRLDRRRLVGLFRPYRMRLGAVLFLILISAALGMVSPFLLRAILDQAIPESDTTLLAALVAGMIAIAVVTGALGVAQTLISNTVGQRVMHDLRAAVYRHLQRLSLAFFTRTRTGEIQSRIANDIGGVQGVVTNTATSIVSNVTTVLAATVAMFLLDWRLALAALGLLPFFVWLTRRVGEERRRITAVRQDRLADISALVEESLSVSGILLGKTMGRSSELAERFERESGELAELEVRSRMAGRWRMASMQISFAAMPALIYLFAGLTIAGGSAAITIGTLVAFTTLQTRLFFPVQSLLSVGVDVQSSLALFERVFEYLELPVEITERQGAVELAPEVTSGAVAFEGVGFRYAPDGPWTLRSISRSHRGPNWPSSGRPAPGRRRSRTCSPASTRSKRGEWRSTASTCATSAMRRLPRSSESSRRRPTSSMHRSRTISALPTRPQATRRSRRRPGRRRSMT
jgi:ATP-binding cassette, subfamily B, bacterial